MKQKDIEHRLVLAAEQQANKLGYRFSPDCLNVHLTPFLEGGAERLKTDNLLDDELQIALAEANVVRLVTAMAIEARKLNLDALQEKTFLNVKLSFCPFYPFC